MYQLRIRPTTRMSNAIRMQYFKDKLVSIPVTKGEVTKLILRMNGYTIGRMIYSCETDLIIGSINYISLGDE